jgi:hypothetical protein
MACAATVAGVVSLRLRSSKTNDSCNIDTSTNDPEELAVSFKLALALLGRSPDFDVGRMG